jgi:ADP-ribose pyrophosphatase YjhB (NUDIX family)
LATLRHTRYQAAVVHNGAILLVHCAFRNGPTVWMLPGGGREESEDEHTCVLREVLEESQLSVRVERLLFDTNAEPADGPYVRWRTYLCTVVGGTAAAGGGEGASAELIDVMWLPLATEARWPADIQGDPFLAPQLRAIATQLVGSATQSVLPAP